MPRWLKRFLHHRRIRFYPSVGMEDLGKVMAEFDWVAIFEGRA